MVKKQSKSSPIGKVTEILPSNEVRISTDHTDLNFDTIYFLNNGSVNFGKVLLVEQNAKILIGKLICTIPGFNVRVGDILSIQP